MCRLVPLRRWTEPVVEAPKYATSAASGVADDSKDELDDVKDASEEMKDGEDDIDVWVLPDLREGESRSARPEYVDHDALQGREIMFYFEQRAFKLKEHSWHRWEVHAKVNKKFGCELRQPRTGKAPWKMNTTLQRRLYWDPATYPTAGSWFIIDMKRAPRRPRTKWWRRRAQAVK